MRHLLSKFYFPKGTILDFCIGTGLTANVCPLAPKRIKISGCEADSYFLSTEFPSLPKVFVRQMLNVGFKIIEPSGNSESDEKVPSRKGMRGGILLKESAASFTTLKSCSWIPMSHRLYVAAIF